MTNLSMDESFSEQERIEAEKNAEDASKKADLKQHADKLIQGFAEIDVPACHRAIWELVQNACDLSAECRVAIDYSGGGFSFSHNGKPFQTETLISLIKQVSSKYDGDEVGRFGTGFITTHAFGRKFKINSLLEVKGKYISIADFLIDRTPMEWKGMADKLLAQERQVYAIIRTGALAPSSMIKTTFTYLPDTDTEKWYITNSYANLHAYIPMVLTVNERLVEMTVIDNEGGQVTYKKVDKKLEGDCYVTSIHATHGLITVYSLQDTDGEVEVILPLKDGPNAYMLGDDMAKLFLYYPLIGTEGWGCNFIIHSKKFGATEHRNGIHLKSKNEQVQAAEAVNRGLIMKASTLIFDYVKKNSTAVRHPICLAKIAFPENTDKPLLNEYFTGLKASWIETFKDCSLVETAAGNITPSQAVFLTDELAGDGRYADAIYAIASKFWSNLPRREIAAAWTNVLQEWGSSAVQYKETKDLVQEVHKSGALGEFDRENIKSFCNFLIEKGHSGYFTEYGLLPNIKGDFRPLGSLNNRINLPKELLDIADVIAPDIPKRHIDPDFIFHFQLTPYDRKSFSSEVNEIIGKKIGDKTVSPTLDTAFLSRTLEYCKVVSLSDSTTIPSRLFKRISRFYDQEDGLLVIAPIKEDELDVRTAQRRIIRMFLNDISTKDKAWVTENIALLEEVISLGSTYADYQEMFSTLPVYPNRLYELCFKANLKVDQGIADEVKELYNKVVPSDNPIDASFAHPLVVRHLPDAEKRNARSLTEKIEQVLSGDNQYANINEHPHKEIVLLIIKKITSDEEWAKLFPLLANKRANVMLDRVSDNKIKDNVFRIISLEADDIQALGSLVQTGKMKEIISLGLRRWKISNKGTAILPLKGKLAKDSRT